MIAGKALQDVLIHVAKRMKNTTQDTSHYVLKKQLSTPNFMNSSCLLLCVYLFQKKESELGG